MKINFKEFNFYQPLSQKIPSIVLRHMHQSFTKLATGEWPGGLFFENDLFFFGWCKWRGEKSWTNLHGLFCVYGHNLVDCVIMVIFDLYVLFNGLCKLFFVCYVRYSPRNCLTFLKCLVEIYAVVAWLNMDLISIYHCKLFNLWELV